VAFLRKNRRYAIVINAVLAAVITPSQDWFSMVAMLVPLLFFYEASIWIAKLMQGRARVKASEGEDHDDTPEDGGDLSQATA
jgi:sec-independent protein translocase protein TatC